MGHESDLPCCHWFGPLTDSEGFAEEGRSLVKALASTDMKVNAHDIPHPRTFDNISSMQSTPLNDFVDGCKFLIYHRYWSARPLPASGVHIWRTMFETNGIPSDWLHCSRNYDQLWVPSEFNRATYAASGVPFDKMAIIPCPLPIWAPLLTANLLRTPAGSKDTFTFLSVMRWHRRKGWDLLVRAFMREFSREPSVRLIIKARPFDPERPYEPARQLGEFLERDLERSTKNIHLVTRDLSTKELSLLYGSADAFVLPSRGEGWGRPFVEAMLSGLRTIGPRWGGNLMFMNDSNSLLVDGDLVPVDADASGEWQYFADQMWFEPSVELLQEAMRRAVDEGNWADQDKLGIAAVLLKTYSSKSIGSQMRDALNSWL
jgi:glycosyltransferase involved in cell wall biosynthesis